MNRILIVEDEFLLGVMLQEELQANGYATFGPFTSLVSAVQAARDQSIDLALLDINLNGIMVYPLADELTERGVPFIFLSGYGLQSIPQRFRSAARLAKPYDPADLIKEIGRILPQ